MRIVYRNDLQDIVALQRQVLRHTRMGRSLLVHRFIAVEAILLVICLLLAMGNPVPGILAVFAGVSALAWAFRERSVLLMFKKEMQRQLARNSEAVFREETVLVLGREGLSVTQGGTRVRHPWAGVAHVGEDDRRVYILTEGLRNYAVPKAAVGGDQAARLAGELRGLAGGAGRTEG